MRFQRGDKNQEKPAEIPDCTVVSRGRPACLPWAHTLVRPYYPWGKQLFARPLSITSQSAQGISAHPMNFFCINKNEGDNLKGDRTMPGEAEVQEEFVERAECFGLELDEGLCIDYHPGKLAEIEDALNEERDNAIADQFFWGGCGI